MKREPRFCKWDNKPIPEDKRSDAQYCSPECGWKYRNDQKRRRRVASMKSDPRRETNIKIIKDLMSREIHEIPMKTLDDIGFDFDSYDRFGEFDENNGTTEYIISNVSFTIIGENVKLKYLNDGRT
jgi:predicted nucleic acid-binding Zn ribbon protein